MTFKHALFVAIAACIGLSAVEASNNDFTTLRLELFASDVPASLAFYRDVLGFEVEKQDADYIALRSGATQIALNAASGLAKQHFFNPELQSGRKGLGVEIVLEVHDIEAHFASVKQSGYTILTPLRRRPWGLTDYRVADPDGYYIRISSNK